MNKKIGDLEKGTCFLKRGKWYKKLNDKWSGRTVQDDGSCTALSQDNTYAFFGNNSIVDIEVENEILKG